MVLQEQDFSEVVTNVNNTIAAFDLVGPVIAKSCRAFQKALTDENIVPELAGQMVRNYQQQVTNYFIRQVAAVEQRKLAELGGDTPKTGRGPDEGPREIRN